MEGEGDEYAQAMQGNDARDSVNVVTRLMRGGGLGFGREAILRHVAVEVQVFQKQGAGWISEVDIYPA